MRIKKINQGRQQTVTFLDAIGGEEKVFWYADWGDISIATACDSRKECIETARTYLKRTA